MFRYSIVEGNSLTVDIHLVKVFLVTESNSSRKILDIAAQKRNQSQVHPS
jgi:hypothetical protein